MAQVVTSDSRVVGLTKETTINYQVDRSIPDAQIENGGMSKLATEDVSGNELARQTLEQLHLIRAHLELMTGKQLTITDIDPCT